MLKTIHFSAVQPIFAHVISHNFSRSTAVIMEEKKEKEKQRKMQISLINFKIYICSNIKFFLLIN